MPPCNTVLFFLFNFQSINNFEHLLHAKYTKYEKGPVPTQPEPAIGLGRQTHTSITLTGTELWFRGLSSRFAMQMPGIPQICPIKISREPEGHQSICLLFNCSPPLGLILKYNKGGGLLISVKNILDLRALVTKAPEGRPKAFFGLRV